MGSALANIQSTGDPTDLMQVDAWAWAKYGNLQLVGGPFSTAGHEFQVEILQDDSKRQCFKKATQFAGGTEAYIIKILHGLRFKRYRNGFIYYFPAANEVSDFSASRFKPLLTDNYNLIGKYVKETDRANLKQIGKAFLYFRGARLGDVVGKTGKKSLSKMKSNPADGVCYDEYDEMTETAVKAGLARLEASKVRDEFYLANPTIPDYGIDKLYNKSNQKVWMIQCLSCGKETCLELEFPHCLQRQKDGSVIRICKHCKKEIFPRNGYWVALYPAESQVMVGRTLSQLNSMYKDPKDILDMYEDPETDLTTFYNLHMGMAYVAAENRLTISDIFSCCGTEPMQVRNSGPCAMGVDVGKVLHVVIGERTHSTSAKIVKTVRVSSFNDVHDLARVFNVRSTVFDLNPETRAVRDYRAAERFSVFGCEYMEGQKGVAAWDERNGVVTVNRTEIFDATHNLITTEGRCVLPRKDDEIEQYALEMCNTAKVLREDDETGSKKYFYVKLGPEHYRNATNYFFLALQKIKPRSRMVGNVTTTDYYWDS